MRRPTTRSAPILVAIVFSAGLALSTAGSCAPRRGLPDTDPATGKPIDPTAPDPNRPLPPPTAAPTKTSGANGNDPRVSRSRGTPGGIVLLWPRVIPSNRTADLRYAAQPLRAALYALVQKAHPGKAIDARPEPERVCPQGGCLASSVGVLLLAAQNGCVAVVQTARPGRGPATQTPWAGSVTLKSPTVPFREPPESYVRISDYVPCADLAKHIAQREAQVLRAIQALP